jgi:hypothetical protein
MDFLVDVLIGFLAVLGLLLVIVSIGAAAVLSYQERYGHSTASSFDQAFSVTDRLHAEAQRAIRDLQNLENRRGT